ncbi:MAG: hypothetical protein ABI315_15830 [Bacteroidia bacterium]
MKYYKNNAEIASFEKEYQIEKIGIAYYLENYLGYTNVGYLKNITNEYIITNDNHCYHIASDIIAFFIQENIFFDLLKKGTESKEIRLFCKLKETIVIDLIAIHETEIVLSHLIKNSEKQQVKVF